VCLSLILLFHRLLFWFSVGFAASVGRVLEVSRVSVAWMPVGICMSALDKTFEYVEKRQAFHAPLSSYQLIQGKYNTGEEKMTTW
jgi:hypothetical protein